MGQCRGLAPFKLNHPTCFFNLRSPLIHRYLFVGIFFLFLLFFFQASTFMCIFFFQTIYTLYMYTYVYIYTYHSCIVYMYICICIVSRVQEYSNEFARKIFSPPPSFVLSFRRYFVLALHSPLSYRFIFLLLLCACDSRDHEVKLNTMQTVYRRLFKSIDVKVRTNFFIRLQIYFSWIFKKKFFFVILFINLYNNCYN